MVGVLDHGYATVVRHNLSDEAAILAAKVSFDTSDLDGVDFERFIGFLMKNRHGTPFEQCSVTFEVKAPIFVFREWHRHRIGISINEMSGRYTVLPSEWYVPARDDIRHQLGKPGSYTFVRVEDDDWAEAVRGVIDRCGRTAFAEYNQMLLDGVAKEIARLVLPVNTYSKMHWTCNPRSLMSFLSLRNAPDAQREIRCYAQALEDMFLTLMPITAQAFIDNGRVAP